MRFFTKAAALLGLLFTGASPAFAQQLPPANDLPTGAILIPNGVPAACPAIGATDNLPGLVGCQQGAVDHPEVWYAFQAYGTRLIYELTGNSTSSIEALVFDGNPNDSTAFLLHTQCGGNALRDTVDGLIAGRTYYIAAASTMPVYTYSLTVNTAPPGVLPAQDCSGAVVLSQMVTINQISINTGAGMDPNEVSTTNSCWGSGGERQSKWYRFVAGASIPLQFNINPNTPNDDYDWAVWDITTDALGCTTKGSAIACNWTGQRGATGLSLNPAMEPGFQGGNQFDNTTTNQTGANAPIQLQAGHAYALLIDNFSQTNSGYTLTFGGVGLPPNPNQRPSTTGLSARFRPTALSGRQVGFAPAVLAAGTNVTYRWTFGDGTNSTLATPTHTYTADGLYTVVLTVTDIYGRSTTYGKVVRVGAVTGVPADVRARLSLAPNPAHGTARLTVVPGTAPSAQILDGLGRVVRVVNLTTTQTEATLPLDDLRPGLYTVRVGAATRSLLVE